MLEKLIITSLHCTESLKHNDMEHLVYRWQINLTAEF